MNETPAVGSTRVRTILTRNLWLQGLLVVLVCAAVYWPLLGRGGLAMSEGHRVIPGWEMLDSGDWLTPQMFGEAYVRKPPGMSWAVAVSSMAFGRTEWAARAVSALAATLMALVAWRVGTRWFGSPWGLAAGLAQALMPQMWESGRSAEIEALDNLGTQVAALAVLEIMMSAPRARTSQRLALGVVLAIGLIVMGLAKGPAGAPVIAGAMISGVIVRRRGIVRPELWGGLALGTLALVGVLYAVWRSVEASGLGSPEGLHGTHLWRPGHLLGVITLAPTAWVWALPASLAFLFVWGPDARREVEGDEEGGERLVRARALAYAWLVSLGIYTALGISNARYAAPAAALLPLGVAYVARGAWRAGAFTDRRRAIARAMLLGAAWSWVVVLTIGAWAYIATREASVRATSGREAGLEMARVLAEGIESGQITTPTTLAADDAIEARPEVLGYARRELARAGHAGELQMAWVVGNWEDLGPKPGGLTLIRLDAGSEEYHLIEQDEGAARLVELGRYEVHKYTFGLYLRTAP
ncbi:MAG: glycosyltransferase family 39 protein [Phycisphaerales bacterium]